MDGFLLFFASNFAPYESYEGARYPVMLETVLKGLRRTTDDVLAVSKVRDMAIVLTDEVVVVRERGPFWDRWYEIDARVAFSAVGSLRGQTRGLYESRLVLRGHDGAELLALRYPHAAAQPPAEVERIALLLGRALGFVRDPDAERREREEREERRAAAERQQRQHVQSASALLLDL